MKVSGEPRSEEFIAKVVEEGRDGSTSEVVREGLRPVEQREAKLRALRAALDAAVGRGGSHSDDDVAAAIRARLDSIGEPSATG